MGNKRIGRIAIRVWLGFLVLGALLLFLAMTSRKRLLSLALETPLLSVGRWVLIVGAIAWVALIVDAWRLGRPLKLRRSHRLWMTGINSALCFVTAGALFFAAHLVAVQTSFVDSVFVAHAVSKPEQGRYNVLLLGGDSGTGRVGPAARLADRRQHRQGDRANRVVRPAPQPAGRPVPQGVGDGQGVPQRLQLRGPVPQRHQHLGQRPRAMFKEKNPGINATMGAVEEITGPQDQLLRDGQPARLLQARRRRRRRDGERQERTADRRHRRADPRLDRARRADTSTATRRCGTPAAACRTTTSRAWAGRSA